MRTHLDPRMVLAIRASLYSPVSTLPYQPIQTHRRLLLRCISDQAIKGLRFRIRTTQLLRDRSRSRRRSRNRNQYVAFTTGSRRRLRVTLARR